MSDTPQPGWQDGRYLDRRTYDGRNGILVASKVWIHPDGRKFCLPENSGSDGASVPDFLSSLGLTWWGSWFMAAHLHDCAYRNTLLVWDVPTDMWVQAALDFVDCNNLFKAAMELDHVRPEIVEMYYTAVCDFGWASFAAARAKNPTGDILRPA